MPRNFVKKNGFQLWRHMFTGFNKTNGEAKTFFIELFIVNTSLYPQEFVLGLSGQKDKKDRLMKPSYVLIKAGCYGTDSKQIHQFFATKKLKINSGKNIIQIEDNIMSDTELKGSVFMNYDDAHNPEFMSDAGSMKWNLQMQKILNFNVKKSATLGNKKTQMSWQVPGLKTQFAGAVLLDGDEYVVYPQKFFGYSDCIWGKDFANPLIYLSGCNLVSQISGKRLMFSAFSACGFFGKEKNKKVLLAFNHEGSEYSFNNNIFTKNKNDVAFEYTENEGISHWSITAQNKKSLVDIEIFSKKDEMIPLNYENPLGIKKHNYLLAGGNGYGEIKLYKKINKSLEIIEHARIESSFSMYGKHK